MPFRSKRKFPSRRKRSRRGRKRKVVRKLTSQAIHKALSSVRRFRGQDLLAITSTTANSDFPVFMRAPSNNTYTSGYTLFLASQLLAAAGQDAPASISLPLDFVSDPTSPNTWNGIKFHGFWCKGQIRNVALNPVTFDLYDVFVEQDVRDPLTAYSNALHNYMMYLIYNGYNDLMNATNLAATVRDTAEAAWSPANAAAWGFHMTNDYLSPVGPVFKEWFKVVKKHKVVLAPGQSYIWKVKGFRPYTYSNDKDSGVSALKNVSYIPLFKIHGELGNSSSAVPGYCQLNCALKFDWGFKAYNIHRIDTPMLGTALPTMPANATSIVGPSDDVLAA